MKIDLLLLVAFVCLQTAGAPQLRPGTPAPIYGETPLSFEQNQGQAPTRVKFRSVTREMQLELYDDGATLILPKISNPALSEAPPAVTRVTMRIAGGNERAPWTGTAELPGKVNYLVGPDSSHWKRGVPTFSKVSRSEVYPGIDLVFYGNQKQFEYDFIVGIGKDPSVIKIQFEGAERLTLGPGQEERGRGEEFSLRVPR